MVQEMYDILSNNKTTVEGVDLTVDYDIEIKPFLGRRLVRGSCRYQSRSCISMPCLFFEMKRVGRISAVCMSAA